MLKSQINVCFYDEYVRACAPTGVRVYPHVRMGMYEYVCMQHQSALRGVCGGVCVVADTCVHAWQRLRTRTFTFARVVVCCVCVHC